MLRFEFLGRRLGWVRRLLVFVVPAAIAIVLVFGLDGTRPADAAAAPTSADCIVGDSCPPQRLVGPTGRCLSFFSSEVFPSMLNNCTDRAGAYAEGLWQVGFRSDGTLRSSGQCLTYTSDVRRSPCTGNSNQQWSLVDNEIRHNNGQCLVQVGQSLDVQACAAGESDDWGFIAINPSGPYSVRGIYMIADDSTITSRSGRLDDILNRIQQDFSGWGYTFTVDPNYEFDTGLDCSALSALGDYRPAVIRKLSLVRALDLNTKYAIVAECPTTSGGLANADRTMSVYSRLVFQNAIAQLDTFGSGAAPDGSMSEVGAFGHELGHSFGLDHENCIIGGWQGGIDEGGRQVAAGQPTTETRGLMCNGVYYPNVNPPSEYQQDVLERRSCRWFSECSGEVEWGSDGRPWDCWIMSDAEISFTASPTERTVQFHRFTFQEGTVESYDGFSNQTGAAATDWESWATGGEDWYLLGGADNYFSISEVDVPLAGNAFRCFSKVAGWSSGSSPDDDSDGIPNAVDQCPATPPMTAVNSLGCARPIHTCDGQAATLVGTPGDDTLVGTPGDDVIVAYEGDDDISAFGGNDIICAGDGNDVVFASSGVDLVFGEDGNDLIFGGDGDDELFGGPGVDELYGRAGNDRMLGGPGNDLIDGDEGADFIAGLDGDDRLVGDEGNDRISGGMGSDTLIGALGHDLLFGDDGNDVLYGGGGQDEMYGAGGSDQLYGDGGNDFLNGGGGNDLLEGHGGADDLTGGAGIDVLRGGDQGDHLFGGSDGDFIDGQGGNDTIEGGGGDDSINGGDGGDTIRGGQGDDTMFGGSGIDRMFGGNGNDVIDGGLGNDRLSGLIGDDEMNGGDGDDVLDGHSGADVMNGGEGNDILRGGEGDDTLHGDNGDDNVSGGLGADTLHGDDGDDRVVGGGGDDPFVSGGPGNDRVQGDSGNDIVLGDSGVDVVIGGSGDDILLGGANNDFVTGGVGNDQLDGGGGKDELTGGGGNDSLDGGFGNADSCAGNAGVDTATRCEIVTGVP